MIARRRFRVLLVGCAGILFCAVMGAGERRPTEYEKVLKVASWAQALKAKLLELQGQERIDEIRKIEEAVERDPDKALALQAMCAASAGTDPTELDAFVCRLLTTPDLRLLAARMGTFYALTRTVESAWDTVHAPETPSELRYQMLDALFSGCRDESLLRRALKSDSPVVKGYALRAFESLQLAQRYPRPTPQDAAWSLFAASSDADSRQADSATRRPQWTFFDMESGRGRLRDPLLAKHLRYRQDYLRKLRALASSANQFVIVGDVAAARTPGLAMTFRQEFGVWYVDREEEEGPEGVAE